MAFWKQYPPPTRECASDRQTRADYRVQHGAWQPQQQPRQPEEAAGHQTQYHSGQVAPGGDGMEADVEGKPTLEKAYDCHAWDGGPREGCWPGTASRCSDPGEAGRSRRLSAVARKVHPRQSLVPARCSSGWQYEVVPRLAGGVAGEAVGVEDSAEEAVFVLSLTPDLPDHPGQMGQLDPMDPEVASGPGIASSAAPVGDLADGGMTQELDP